MPECTGENTAIPSDVQLTDAPATEESTAMDIIPFDLNSADADNSESTVDVAGTLTATMSTMNGEFAIILQFVRTPQRFEWRFVSILVWAEFCR